MKAPQSGERMLSRTDVLYRFGDCLVNPTEKQLLRDGKSVPLQPKVFDTLLLLLESQGRLIQKDEFLSRLWPDSSVEEVALAHCISHLRKALLHGTGDERSIETVPKRGYRFVAAVEVIRPVADEKSTVVRVAVLPFENLGAGPEREYLVDGLTEETIATIGQIDPKHFSVIGRTSVMRYKRTTRTLAEIGRELDASYLIESSLRAEGSRLRITSKLIRVRDQLQIWSASYDSEPSSLLTFQRELSIAIAEQVRLRLSPVRLTALVNRQTQNPEAYDLYLHGRYFWNQLTGQTTRRAIEYFTHATTLDAKYALAWAGLADCYTSAPVHGDAPPLLIMQKARDAIANAISAEPNLAEVQIALGNFNFWLGWDWSAAEAAYRRGIAFDPNLPLAHRMLGVVLSHSCRHDEARSSMQRARELDPLYVMHQSLSSHIAFDARDFRTALYFARQALVVDPEFWIAQLHLAQVAVELGDYDLALDALNKAGRLSAGNTKALSLRGYIFGKTGRVAESLEVLQTLEAVARERFVPPYAIALIHAGLGDTDLALEWLARAFDSHDVHLVFLPVDPKWDPFRIEPRFMEVLKRCGFTKRRA
jgi:DNA-binding winged helix-turn-helix (wHTH) protein/tetratricopeptide (TPR) repeat protein